MRKHWNYFSGVTCCETCEGDGMVASLRRPTVDDPYPEQVCPDCDGPHPEECPVCGFNQSISGYDCLACETAAAMFPDSLADFDVDAFAAALKVAVGLALADARKVAA